MDFYSTLLAKKLNKASGGDVEVESLVVSENGRYSETGKAYNPVVVNVPQPVLTTKTITSNDTYNAADDNADGYSAVTVNVQPSLETLNATENGTYTPQGDGYDEVNINVPLPANGYLLETASGDVVTVTDAGAFPLASCEVNIKPIQEGSGTPSTSNIRPINGISELTLTDKDNPTNPTVTKTYTIQLNQTVYGARLDVTKGELVVETGYYTFDGTESPSEYGSGYKYNCLGNAAKIIYSNVIPNAISDRFVAMDRNGYYLGGDGFSVSGSEVFLPTNTPNGVQVCYELATPITIPLTPTLIELLQGNNTIYANSGDISIEYFGKGVRA